MLRESGYWGLISVRFSCEGAVSGRYIAIRLHRKCTKIHPRWRVRLLLIMLMRHDINVTLRPFLLSLAKYRVGDNGKFDRGDWFADNYCPCGNRIGRKGHRFSSLNDPDLERPVGRSNGVIFCFLIADMHFHPAIKNAAVTLTASNCIRCAYLWIGCIFFICWCKFPSVSTTVFPCRNDIFCERKRSTKVHRDVPIHINNSHIIVSSGKS